MIEVVDGVLYLHSHGIIHRDLTLGNLLLTKDRDVVCFSETKSHKILQILVLQSF